jgi:hypothetical protein
LNVEHLNNEDLEQEDRENQQNRSADDAGAPNAPTLDPQLSRLLAQVAAETERRAGGMSSQEAEPRGISRSRANFEENDGQIQCGDSSINILEQGRVLKRF